MTRPSPRRSDRGWPGLARLGGVALVMAGTFLWLAALGWPLMLLSDLLGGVR